MNQLFNIDNPVMQFISKIFDLVILNLIFILFSIPVITMGEIGRASSRERV